MLFIQNKYSKSFGKRENSVYDRKHQVRIRRILKEQLPVYKQKKIKADLYKKKAVATTYSSAVANFCPVKYKYKIFLFR